MRIDLRHFIPSSLRLTVRQARLAASQRLNETRPAAMVFDGIYRKGVWGGSVHMPCSGVGSRGRAVDEYVRMVVEFAKANDVRSIIDIGCGDFQVGRRLTDSLGPACRYVGVDVASIVVQHNNRTYARDHVSFMHCDAGEEDMPGADLYLVRQVFQHLSNAQICRILDRLDASKRTIVTEHIPLDDDIRVYNLDKPHGPDTRIEDGSGVFLDRFPFNLGLTELLDVRPGPSDGWDGRIVSWLLQRPGATSVAERSASSAARGPMLETSAT